MLAAVLGFGLFWPAVAPELVKPGMTPEQVEAILGRSTAFTAGGRSMAGPTSGMGGGA